MENLAQNPDYRFVMLHMPEIDMILDYYARPDPELTLKQRRASPYLLQNYLLGNHDRWDGKGAETFFQILRNDMRTGLRRYHPGQIVPENDIADASPLTEESWFATALNYLLGTPAYAHGFDDYAVGESADNSIPYPSVDPLVLSLDNKGLESYGSRESTVMFDFDGDGRKNITGWVGPGNGFLVFVRNSDGLINDGSELFSDFTLRYDGSGRCSNGFEALAQEDSNGDGIIDADDANFGSLKIWIDDNQDGITDAGELHSLDDFGIVSLDFNPVSIGESLDNGNFVHSLVNFYTSDGLTHNIYDLIFNERQAVSVFNDSLEVPLEISQNLPNFGGSGALRSLWEACTQSDNLTQILTQFSEASSREAQMSFMTEP
jgi:hypothetical protein